MSEATLVDFVPESPPSPSRRRAQGVVLHAEPALAWPSLDPHYLDAVRRSSDTYRSPQMYRPPLALGGHGLVTLGPAVRCLRCHATASGVADLPTWCAGATRALLAGAADEDGRDIALNQIRADVTQVIEGPR